MKEKETHPKIPEKGLKELRKGRISQRGSFYFITTCCYKKQKFFLNKENVEIFFIALDWIKHKEFIEPYFCIVMPDHVHLVFQLIGDKSLPDVIKSLKQCTGRKIKQRLGIENTVWQKGYYDHTIRKDEDLIEIMKYCWHNPVRAGMVENPKDYPYWVSKYDLE